jgi:ankyrin repeat protein
MTQKELNSSLFKYAKLGDLINIKLLLEQGADIHAQDDYALRLSASKGNLDMVKYLIEQVADNKVDDNYALKYSAYHGNLEILKYLNT